MQIVAFDTDDRADGDTTINNGKAKITWISRGLLATKHSMNDTTTTSSNFLGMKNYLNDSIMPLIPETIRNNIVEVTKKNKSTLIIKRLLEKAGKSFGFQVVMNYMA